MFRKVLFFIFAIYSLSFAQIVKKGDAIRPFTLTDQFDKVHQVNSKDYDLLIVAFEKDVAVMFNDFLAKQKPSFLSEHKALFISDIHEMPTFITKMFALPKMRDYPYSVLLIYDESNIFPKKEDSLTIIRLKNGVIDDIDFISDEKDIEKIFK